MIQLYLVAFSAVVMVGAVIREQYISRTLSARGCPTWEEVLYQLKPVRTQGLREIALRRSSAKSRPEGTASAYSRIGGEEGLRRMLHNSPVVLDLACCSLEWRSSEGEKSPAVEKIRQANMRLRLLARLSTMLIKCGASGTHTNACLQKFAATYCDMVDELIKLYSEVHMARVNQLVAACNW